MTVSLLKLVVLLVYFQCILPTQHVPQSTTKYGIVRPYTSQKLIKQSLNSLLAIPYEPDARTSDNVQLIDTDLYSRQLFVYGATAQQRLSESKILILGKSSLACEIAKNLALAGVGSITVQDIGSETLVAASLIGKDTSLLSYLQSLNPQIKVGEH